MEHNRTRRWKQNITSSYYSGDGIGPGVGKQGCHSKMGTGMNQENNNKKGVWSSEQRKEKQNID